MLAHLGLEFTLAPADIDETLLPGEDAGDAAQRLAASKGAIAAANWPQDAVLSADTLVVHENKVLGKPVDDDQSWAMLNQLSGSEHKVVTGYCLFLDGSKELGLARSLVRFRRLSPAEIEAYVNSGEGRDKAGAYAVQGLAAAFVESVEGSYTNVVGLPLAALVKLMLRHEVIEPVKGKKG
jgi:septum formation protein